MTRSTVVITCDGCGADITTTGNCEDYRLSLQAEGKSPWYVREGMSGGFVTSMAAYPPIDATKHFCDLRCLDAWRSTTRTAHETAHERPDHG